jgi:hypothetical protein
MTSTRTSNNSRYHRSWKKSREEIEPRRGRTNDGTSCQSRERKQAESPSKKSTVVKAKWGLSHPVRHRRRSQATLSAGRHQPGWRDVDARARAHKTPRPRARHLSAGPMRARPCPGCACRHSLNRLISDDQLTPNVVSGVQTSPRSPAWLDLGKGGQVAAESGARARVDFRWRPTASDVYRWRRAVTTYDYQWFEHPDVAYVPSPAVVSRTRITSPRRSFTFSRSAVSGRV